jgi:hypothetical protein
VFEIVPEAAFTRWFERLAEPLAEEVASSLEILANAGGALSPSRVTRALLWYDGTSALRAPLAEWQELAVLDAAASAHALVTFEREVLACLGSAPFRERLEKLASAQAETALVGVDRLKLRLKAWRRELLLELGTGKRPSERLRLRKQELTEAFAAVLSAVGLEGERLFGFESGLRELSLSHTSPALRVLFGVDATRQKLIVMLGETLERSYYGDSVRFAEGRWARYQAAALTTASPGPGR